ncbi:FecR family protein [Parabacteroides sp. OttesenSCG-928-J18]|nr:FecR family protein [Parabacteroides sp. OttesenSCG-928-J18]
MDSIIIKYLNGEASEEEKQTLYAWIKEKEENNHYFSNVRDLWITSNTLLSSKKEGDSKFPAFREKVLKMDHSRRQKNTRLAMIRWSAAAVILLICSLSTYFWGKKEVNEPNHIMEQAVTMNQTVIGNTKQAINLPDGSVVWLNANSRLSFPETFSSEERRVKLEGEGYFEVTHNQEAPFFVETDHMVIKVLGTTFDVHSYTNRSISETVLLSGKVEVHLSTGKPITLFPNQKISYHKETEDYTLEEVDASEYAIWTNEKLIMASEELGTIFRKLERWYDIRILYDETIPVHAKYSLTIRDESKEEMLRSLSIIAPISYQINKDTITMTRK